MVYCALYAEKGRVLSLHRATLFYAMKRLRWKHLPRNTPCEGLVSCEAVVSPRDAEGTELQNLWSEYLWPT